MLRSGTAGHGGVCSCNLRSLEAGADEKFKTSRRYFKPLPTTRKEGEREGNVHGCVQIKHKVVNRQPDAS